ncbi:MAG: AAA family ATPase, partial [Oscillospiraceae bacterium]
MRPLKLTMSAFGPYMGKETIDFETLGKSGLFLITGNTGAGKTTVFDGISYALFGEPSGTGRDARTVRNMQAAMEEKPCDTYVEFEFEYKQKRYKILRNPEYERPAKRGGGTAVQKSDCVFTDCDGKVITGNNAVLNKVKELLGIDREQFRQIVMLAQGDFQRLLFSSTDDKSAIFRKLFDTGNYNKLQLKISEEYNAARSEYS